MIMAPRKSTANSSNREALERRLVVTIVAVFMVAAGVLLTITTRASSSAAASQVAMTKAFGQVHEQQGQFRALNGRFASWPELEGQGARLPRNQVARAWTADASHWFLSIRDTNTGVVCDRTGELFDEDPEERKPTCRDKKNKLAN
jgi:hypothetical protein